ncbi:MAG: hypothetical protein QOE77_2821 [Blastocatellia bacterium]|jgi:subtilisin family serine protease|nr:hypothetical protein [Blastocatellia bacterium]
MLFQLMKRLAASHRVLFGLILGLLLVSAIVLPPGSRATQQSSTNMNASGSGDVTKKRARAEFVPGEALVRFKKGTAIEGSTYVAMPGADRRAAGRMAAPQVSQEQILMRVERFEGSDLIDGLRLAHVKESDTIRAIEALRARSDVLYAEPNYILHADSTTPNDTNFGQLYGLNKIGAPQAWDQIRGSVVTAAPFFGAPRVVVGVVDEGIDTGHPDLQGNIFVNSSPGDIPGISGDVNGYNFRDNTGTVFSGSPAEDHATHVAGTIGARGDNGQGVVGVNWQVSLMSLKFLGPTGGSDADAIRAFSYAKQMRERYLQSSGTYGANIRVLNNSYGGSGYSQITADAISALGQAGILFVAAAGNDGTNNDVAPHYPSSYSLPNMISVTATSSTDSQVFNYGAHSVLIGAPGVGILSTTPGSTAYQSFSGTSMAAPHVSGAAALICAAFPNISLNQLRGALAFNGDLVPALQGKTLTGRRLNVKKSLDAIAEGDTTPPGTPAGFQITSQNGRTVNLSWTASGDDASAGQASLYDLSLTDSTTNAVVPLTTLAPAAAGNVQTLSVKLPYRHSSGTIKLREFDNVGNEGTPATVSVNINPLIADPYTTSVTSPVTLSAGGTPLGLTFDDRYREDFVLPFSFPYFGQLYNKVTVSSNGNLYFSAPPKRSNGDADDVPSSIADLSRYKMIAGLWDDIDLRTSRRADADVYVKKPDATRIIFRWQGVDFENGNPVNFEIELRADGSVKTRYGSGNIDLHPVVGISGGEPDAYVIDSLTAETSFRTLTNAETAVFTPRQLRNPIDDTGVFVSQHYFDFLNRAPDDGGFDYWTNEINKCGNDAACIEERRIGVSGSFFVELEFQETGYVVYRFYRAAYGTRPATGGEPAAPNRANITFSQFKADRPLLVGGAGLAQSTIDFANVFVQRTKFLQEYPNTMTNSEFVNKLFDMAGIADASLRQSEIDAMTLSGKTRAQVLLSLIEVPAFKTREYNPAWVLMEYFGYLRRDAEQGGYDFWLDVLNNQAVNNYRGMVCSFITSQEYQERFGSTVTRTNALCSGVH